MTSVISNSEVRTLLQQAARDALLPGNTDPTYEIFARSVERVVIERTNPRIVLLRKRWLPLRVLAHYRLLRTYQCRGDALRLAWRFARA